MPKLKEEWKQVLDYPGYSVSNTGKVKKGLIKKLSVNVDGFLVTKLTNDLGTKNIPVHRLVYTAFVNDLENWQLINHIDGDKKNNQLDNLSVKTRSGITNKDVEFIRRNAKKLGGTLSNAELARMHNVSRTAIFKIVNGQSRNK